MPTQTKSSTARYNGWSNYETWVANLWLNNDEQSYRVLLQAKESGASVYEQADWLKSLLEMQLADEIAVPCMWQDLLRGASGQINWVEILEVV